MRLAILICLHHVFSIAFAKSAKIVGGDNAHITEFPYMASFRYVSYNQHFCGGAIVSRWNILTSAHCLFYDRANLSNIRIYTGCTSTTDVSGPSHDIDHVDFHPLFTATKNTDEMNLYDVAVVTVKERLKFNRYQHQAFLATEDIKHHDIGVFAGWGLTVHPSETLPAQLQTVALRIFDNDYCAPWLSFTLRPQQFCAYHRVGIGCCNGDSGGPLVIDNKIVGVLSFSLPCAIGIPDVFTKIYSVTDFIIPLLLNT